MDRLLTCLIAAGSVLLTVRAEVFKGKTHNFLCSVFCLFVLQKAQEFEVAYDNGSVALSVEERNSEVRCLEGSPVSLAVQHPSFLAKSLYRYNVTSYAFIVQQRNSCMASWNRVV